MGAMRGLAGLTVGVTLAAVTSCSSSSPGAQAPLPAARTTSRSAAVPSATPTSPSPSPSRWPTPAPRSSSPSTSLFAPPRTPATVAGAEQLVRAYFTALNAAESQANVTGAHALTGYVLPSCALCFQFDRNTFDDAVRTQQVRGRLLGAQFTTSHLFLESVATTPPEVGGSIRFYDSSAKILDSAGKVVASGPGGPIASYILYERYRGGQWRIYRLEAAP